MGRTVVVLLACLSLTGAGCPSPPHPSRSDASPPPGSHWSRPAWPALPRTLAEAERLIALRTRRDPGRSAPSLSPTQLLALPALGEGRGLVAGEGAVWRWLGERLRAARAAGRSVYLLFGSHHDSGAQLETFRRAVGPVGLLGLSAVTLEQLDATGAWQGISLSQQLGDDPLLERLLRAGDPRDWSELQTRQIRQDYTAWKYGFVDAVLDLVTTARALRLPLAGCDMPRSLQDRAALESPARDRLRELHCLLALEDRLARRPAGPRLVAMFWGQEHVRPHGLPRFLPPDALVLSVYLVGARPNPLTPEAELGRRLVVNDLLLVPLDREAEQLTLLLPGPPLGGELGRAREWLTTAGNGPCLLQVSSQLAGELFLAGRRIQVGPKEREVELPATSAAYVLRAGTMRLAGALELVAGGTVELHFDPIRRATSVALGLPHSAGGR